MLEKKASIDVKLGVSYIITSLAMCYIYIYVHLQ
jgi:hypothetical protein